MAASKSNGTKQSVGGVKKMPSKMPLQVVPQRGQQKAKTGQTPRVPIRPYGA